MLNNTARITIICAVIIYYIIILKYLKEKTLNLKYSLLWLFAGLVMVILAIFPQLLNVMSGLIGIYNPVYALFLVAIGFVIVILMSITSIVSRQNRKIRTLIQENAILEKRIRDLENKKD